MLALLLIAATGAWAAAVAGETITLKCGSTVKTYENVTLPWSTTADILKQVITDMNFMPPSIGTITEGDGKVVKNGNENFQVTGTFSGEATVAVTYYNSSMTSSTATITVTAPGAAGTSGSGDVKMAEGTEDAENWTLSDGTNTAKGNVGLTGVPEKTKVTATYGGTKKVKSVKAVKYVPDPKATPLTFEVLTDGKISISFPRNGIKYSLNGGEKTGVPGTGGDITVKAGDKVEFYGNGGSYYNMGSDHTSIGGTAQVKVYGNIMSLLSETNFATATTLTAENTFREFFRSYSNLIDASGLLLPATTLTNNCYYGMFSSCSGMTAAPAELPAETLASSCYYEMFSSCSKLTTAPVLPATSLVSNCYRSMFSYCSKLSSVTCLATSGIDSNNSTYNWMLYAGSQAAGDKTFTADKTAEWPNTGNGIPSGWTRVDYVAPGN